MTKSTAQLSQLGVSIWLDDLSKDRLVSGSLASLMASHHVVGVTSNPTIFAGSVAGSDSYHESITAMQREGATSEEAVFRIMIADVQGACDLLAPVFTSTNGQDGRVSLEVSPELARDTEGTVAQAIDLWKRVDRPNLMVKIPATLEGLPAITRVIAEGISVNVTLIFSVERYQQVIEAYRLGITEAQARGIDVANIFSVASFFVSRVDTAVDAALDALGTPEAKALRSTAAIANARIAYEVFQSDLASHPIPGMNPQRPLWASTGVKDPALPPALYVTELATAHTVNTMPEATLMATGEHTGEIKDAVTPHYENAHSVMASLEAVGIDMKAITTQLESEGVDKFVVSWRELLATVDSAMKASQ
jgi:transaldolase